MFITSRGVKKTKKEEKRNKKGIERADKISIEAIRENSIGIPIHQKQGTNAKPNTHIARVKKQVEGEASSQTPPLPILSILLMIPLRPGPGIRPILLFSMPLDLFLTWLPGMANLGTLGVTPGASRGRMLLDGICEGAPGIPLTVGPLPLPLLFPGPRLGFSRTCSCLRMMSSSGLLGCVGVGGSKESFRCGG